MNINGYLDYINAPWDDCYTDWFGIILNSKTENPFGGENYYE